MPESNCFSLLGLLSDLAVCDDGKPIAILLQPDQSLNSSWRCFMIRSVCFFVYRTKIAYLFQCRLWEAQFCEEQSNLRQIRVIVRYLLRKILVVCFLESDVVTPNQIIAVSLREVDIAFLNSGDSTPQRVMVVKQSIIQVENDNFWSLR